MSQKLWLRFHLRFWIKALIIESSRKPSHKTNSISSLSQLHRDKCKSQKPYSYLPELNHSQFHISTPFFSSRVRGFCILAAWRFPSMRYKNEGAKMWFLFLSINSILALLPAFLLNSWATTSAEQNQGKHCQESVHIDKFFPKRQC